MGIGKRIAVHLVRKAVPLNPYNAALEIRLGLRGHVQERVEPDAPKPDAPKPTAPKPEQRVPSKLEMAKTFGATDVVDASQSDAVEAVKELTGGGVQYSFEAIGLKATAEQAFRMLRPGGAATIIGMIPAGVKIELTGSAFLQEKKIQGSMMGSNRFRVDMPRFVDFYLDGKLHLDEMVSKRIDLSEVNLAFDDMKSGNVARSVIVFD